VIDRIQSAWNMIVANPFECVLAQVQDTRHIEFGDGAIFQLGELFKRYFPNRQAKVIADMNTWEVAGRQAFRELERAGISCLPEHVFKNTRLKAEEAHVEALKSSFGEGDSVPVAVGSGTINDLVKLASHETGRPYISVATAASMDGYTSYGASITCGGIKQTKDCPAPMMVVADTSIIREAPPAMNASGYADLLAKVTSGADWMLADSLGEEFIHTGSWNLIQKPLRNWLENPEGIRSGDSDVVRHLMDALLSCGLAMQLAQNSRPASGAEHLFSHLWDMEGHVHEGSPVPHGIQVGIGTLATAKLYEQLLKLDIFGIDSVELCRRRPGLDRLTRAVRAVHQQSYLADHAERVVRKKYLEREGFLSRMERIKETWPDTAGRLRKQLLGAEEIVKMLQAAGAPFEHEAIGIGENRLIESYFKAYTIRERYTVLDFAFETNQLPGVPGELWN